MRRYFEWDYYNDVVIEYRREGSCKQCGECCRTRVAWVQDKPFASDRAGGHAHNNKGVWQEVYCGHWRHFLQLLPIDRKDITNCSALEKNLCIRHKNKAWICREWPFAPICIALFPECGYSFVEIQRGRISELADKKEAD